MFAKMTRRLVLCLAMTCALLSAGAVVASALTYEGVFYLAQERAQEFWGGSEKTQYCHGPYENVRGKTQWACYGYNQDNCWTWQINLDPYGKVTYATHGCPGVKRGAETPGAATTG